MAKKAVFGIAKSKSQAIDVADNLKVAGFTENDVSVLFPTSRAVDLRTNNTPRLPRARRRRRKRRILGGALDWMVGIGALAIPGLGVFIAAGPIMAALAARPVARRPAASRVPSSAWASPSTSETVRRQG